MVRYYPFYSIILIFVSFWFSMHCYYHTYCLSYEVYIYANMPVSKDGNNMQLQRNKMDFFWQFFFQFSTELLKKNSLKFPQIRYRHYCFIPLSYQYFFSIKNGKKVPKKITILKIWNFFGKNSQPIFFKKNLKISQNKL